VPVTPIGTAATSDHGCRSSRSLPAPGHTIGNGACNQAGLFRLGRGLRVGPFFRLAVDLRLLRRGVFARRNVGQHWKQAAEFHGLGEVAVER
jgi:hypothetical protein